MSACSGPSGSPFGAGMRLTSCSSSSATPSPVLALTSAASSAGMPMISSISWITFGGIGRRQVDLVDDRQHFQSLLERRVAVGDALRLDALRGIHHQQRPLAGRQRAGHLVGEVHVSGRVDEVELIDLAALRLEAERDALRLDGDPALALQVHGIEHLRLHLAGIEAAAFLDEAIGQRRFAVIDVGDDGEIADILHQGGLGLGKPPIIPVSGGKLGP